MRNQRQGKNKIKKEQEGKEDKQVYKSFFLFLVPFLFVTSYFIIDSVCVMQGLLLPTTFLYVTLTCGVLFVLSLQLDFFI